LGMGEYSYTELGSGNTFLYKTWEWENIPIQNFGNWNKFLYIT